MNTNYIQTKYFTVYRKKCSPLFTLDVRDRIPFYLKTSRGVHGSEERTSYSNKTEVGRIKYCQSGLQINPEVTTRNSSSCLLEVQ